MTYRERREARAERLQEWAAKRESKAAAGWERVTFSDKPSQEIRDSLKAAGFFFRRGSWFGKKDQIPASITG